MGGVLSRFIRCRRGQEDSDDEDFDEYEDDEGKFKDAFTGDQKQFAEFGLPYVSDAAVSRR